jgi:Fe-S cluster biogenesis protein NfuA
MTDQIKIAGEPVSNVACRFIPDRPLNAGGSFYFDSADKAKGSPLAEELFAIPGIRAALITPSEVTVTKNARDEWPVIGKQIGAAIRKNITSGEPAIAPAVLANLPAETELRDRVQRVLDAEITPAVAAHGGSVSLMDVKGNTVFIRMGGGCQGCGSATATLRTGVETQIRFAVPEVGEIFDTTDHAAGRNPYFAAAAH